MHKTHKSYKVKTWSGKLKCISYHITSRNYTLILLLKTFVLIVPSIGNWCNYYFLLFHLSFLLSIIKCIDFGFIWLWVAGLRPIFPMWDLGLWGTVLRGGSVYGILVRIYVSFGVNHGGRQARLEPGTSRLPVMRAELSATGEAVSFGYFFQAKYNSNINTYFISTQYLLTLHSYVTLLCQSIWCHFE